MAEHDYHIYLHGVGGSNSNSPSMKTTPFANRQEKASVEGENQSLAPFIQKGMQSAYSTITSGGGQYVSQGVAMLTKASPWIALAVAAISIASNIVHTAMETYSSYTGDYRYDIGMNNLKTNISNFLNPYGHWRYQYKREIEIRNNNLKIEQERTLVGNIYTSYKGV